MSLEEVARQVGTDPSNLSRIEKGIQPPKRELARTIFKFYDGIIELGAIYDPEFAAASADISRRTIKKLSRQTKAASV